MVEVSGGHWRGRHGVTLGAVDSINSVRVLLDHRSKYDAERPKDWAWVPIEFLTVRAKT